jgi:protein SCO1/2
MLRGVHARLLWFSLVCAALTGCKHSTEHFGDHTQIYELKGTVVATDPARGEVTLQHEAIPGLMGAMTMPYPVQPPSAVGELHPGDRIHARLVLQKDADGEIHDAQVNEIAIVAQAKPDFKPASNYHVPTAGDAVPDFKLTDQSNHPVQISSYKGKALLITFIYTRCPLGDFCPKMSRNFAAIDKALKADPALYAHTALLSISFDPVYDKPEVLKAYGLNYTTQQGFDHWKFAAPSADSLKPMEEFFNVGVTGSDPATMTHSLSTVLIRPDGKIATWYPGNDWSPGEVTANMRSLATAAPPKS